MGRMVVRSDREELTFGKFEKPGWASAVGRDAFGLFTEFAVPDTEVTQRMRWIPPGRFLMGSPADEEGRWDNEGPRHEVTIAEGFWLFETACTEALWEAVTGRSPEPRRGGEFPVRGVSWDDAQAFVQKVNGAVPGLNLVLPSEAWWEYACRAGTQTPYHFGTHVTKDLACHAADGPVPVGSLPPNGWGLYEMHGNVYEWCADDWHRNYDGAPNDGGAWIDSDRGAARRVIRGGSWDGGARRVRAACRGGRGPADRDGRLGFRCARVHSVAGSEGRG
jgi:formylglycine-generating enzyme required for sulfatase activity